MDRSRHVPICRSAQPELETTEPRHVFTDDTSASASSFSQPPLSHAHRDVLRARRSSVPSTSVVIVNWNGRHHLEHCLPALERQTMAPREVIVVDNASTDGSVDFLREHHPQATIVELRENRGFTGGNIAGLEAASGEYIVLLNNDTMPLPTWLEHLVRVANEHDDIGMVASHLTDWSGSFTDSAGDGCTVTGRGFKRYMNRPTSETIESGYVFSACAGAALYRRDMIADIGFLNDRFFMNCEDTDLAFRAQLRGWKAYFCAEAIVRHRIGASQGRTSQSTVYFSTRNRLWTYVRCMPRRLMIKYFPSFLLDMVITTIYFARKRRLGAHLRARIEVLRTIRSVLDERAEIQESRTVPIEDIESKLEPLSSVLWARLRTRRVDA